MKNILTILLVISIAILLGIAGFLLLQNQSSINNPQQGQILNEQNNTQNSIEERNESNTEVTSDSSDEIIRNNQNDSDAITSDFFESYTLTDDTYGTEVTVTVANNERIIISNALPNHETGTFPNRGNPNSITEQSNTYIYTTNPLWTGNATWAREPGIAINGIKFEPETAERVECTSGEIYRIEALQNTYDLGFDFNNAHVQPDGTYHYHGTPTSLVEVIMNSAEDIVHIGFAADGYMMYYSKSGAYKPSYQLSNNPRNGIDCTYRDNEVTIDNTTPDGIYISDWAYNESLGDLDECNGIIINGEYAYFITDEYPFVSRCLNGEYSNNNGDRGNSGSGPSDQTPFRPPQGDIPPR